MQVKICSCGHDQESHHSDGCFNCTILKRQKCLLFNHTYDASIGRVNCVYQVNRDDHGLKIFNVDMDFSNANQAMSVIIGQSRVKSQFGDVLVKEIKHFFEVKNTSDIENRYCYALRDANDRNGYIRGILSESILGYKNSYVIIIKELYNKFGDNK